MSFDLSVSPTAGIRWAVSELDAIHAVEPPAGMPPTLPVPHAIAALLYVAAELMNELGDDWDAVREYLLYSVCDTLDAASN